MRSSFESVSKLKRQSVEIAQLIKSFDFNDDLYSKEKIHRMYDCGNVATFYCQKTDKGLIPKKLKFSNFCKQRFCPLCASLRSRHHSFYLGQACEQLLAKGYKFSFMTLTVPNVPLSRLSETLTFMLQSLTARFVKREKFKKAYDGYFRNFEVTFKFENGEIWCHPHLHVLCAIPPECYKSGVSYYPQADLVNDWRECIKADPMADCICDIRAVDGRNIKKSVQEVIKYCFDFDSIIDLLRNMNADQFLLLDQSLKNRKYFSINGSLQYNNFHFVQFDELDSKYLSSDYVICKYRYDTNCKRYIFVEVFKSPLPYVPNTDRCFYFDKMIC